MGWLSKSVLSSMITLSLGHGRVHDELLVQCTVAEILAENSYLQLEVNQHTADRQCFPSNSKRRGELEWRYSRVIL